MSVGFISHTDCLAHNMGGSHPESPDRIKAIQQKLIDSGLDSLVHQYQAKTINRELLLLAHDKDYVDFIFKNAPAEGTFVLDADTSMNPASLNAALLSAGAAIDAVDYVMRGDINSAFCATRPPGHHAEKNKAMGFCIFNNVAIAASYAMQKYKLERIAVVDFDVHHGNGTENILKDKSGFLFCSTFQHPFYPFSGTQLQPSHIINTPLSSSAGSEEFKQAITSHWLPSLHQFKPQMLFISAGFDAHIEDTISQVKLVESDYHWVTQQLKTIADQYAQGRIVSILEGGYQLDALSRSVVAHLEGLIHI